MEKVQHLLNSTYDWHSNGNAFFTKNDCYSIKEVTEGVISLSFWKDKKILNSQQIGLFNTREKNAEQVAKEIHEAMQQHQSLM